MSDVGTSVSSRVLGGLYQRMLLHCRFLRLLVLDGSYYRVY